MKKIIGIVILILCVAISVLFSFSPDALTLAILILMTLCVIWGFLFGILPAMRFTDALRTAQDQLHKLGEVQTTSVWLSVQQVESLFQLKVLDQMFSEYLEKARRQERDDQIVPDIEDVFNEESLSLRCWWSVVQQLPGTLTALGLLGTFIGLILGISTIGFSSVEAVLSSIELLLSGIRTAFYTSIAGVILSILFNLFIRLSWNALMRELGLFHETFHTVVFPTVEEQIRSRDRISMERVQDLLGRLPREPEAYFGGRFTSPTMSADVSNEQRMMPDIRNGLKNGEFIFLIQPRYDLNTKKIVSGEALMRWDHSDLGLIYPAAFLSVIERNGFLVRIDKYIWEEICKTIRKWIDMGLRPVPLSVNISKTDILAMDIPEIFEQLIRKYDLSPRNLEIEISESAYLECEDAVHEVEQQLRQSGFRVIIDGFDEEFLTMSVMKNTRADALKLDLRYMGSSSNKRTSVVETMMEQARKLNVPVFAKCIESAEQLSDLRRCGCTEGQGSYLKKPVTVEEFERMTEQNV